MIHKRRCSAPVLSLAIVLVGGVIAGGGAAAAQPPPTIRSQVGAPWSDPAPTVTLITGDKVTLGGPHGATVRPAPGREKIRFQQGTDEHGDITVIPSDAMVPLSSGRLDRRLFNVTDLAEHGYHDAARKDLPLIVDHADAAPRSASISDARVVRDLPSLGAVAVVADKTTAFWDHIRGSATPRTLSGGIEKIWLDGPVRASLDRSVPQIGAPAAWQAGHTGANTTVAVLDSGIDATHPDLADAVAGAQDFTGSPSGTADGYGHGTHVASIITGSGAQYRGVAPDTRLLNGKVLDDTGFGLDSWIIAGMEWAAGQGADVVNMSLGNPFPGDGADPMSQAVNRLTEQTGALFVVAAGNSGPSEETIGSPAAADAALTVGAVDAQDALAEFSSRGPRRGDGAIKPDITAPGVDIVAAKAKDTQLGPPIGEHHVRLSGTSMATPHVAGAAAILAGQHPDWNADQLKPALMGSAHPNPGLSVRQQGSGRVDVARAVNQPVFTTPGSLSLGIASFPHEDDEPIVRTLTYRNTSIEPVTLDLAIDGRDPAGNPAPAGMFTVQPSRVTVPAGGVAAVTVTTDTRVSGPNGSYGGAIVATGGQTSVRTPIAVTKGQASYNVTLTFLDHNGKPAPNYRFQLLNVDRPDGYATYDPSGTVTIRVPEGQYLFDAEVTTPEADGVPITVVTEPELVVSGDTELVVDARDGKPVGFTVDQPNARPSLTHFNFWRQIPWAADGGTGRLYTMRDYDGFFVRPSATSAPGKFLVGTEAHLGEPDGNGGILGSPYLYHLRWSQDGAMPAELIRRVPNRDLATVRSAYAAQPPGGFGFVYGIPLGRLPFLLTEFYTPGEPWLTGVCQNSTPDPFMAPSCVRGVSPKTFTAGSTTTQRWNAAVFGPALPYVPNQSWVGRLENLMGFSYPLFADQGPDRDGFSFIESGRMVLYRDGQQIGESASPNYGVFEVPAAESTYRLHAEATRSVSELSTRVSLDWTFRSRDEGGPKPLPLPVIRFAPALDDHNQARAGQALLIPVYVQRNASAIPGKLNTPTVQVSYDDGKEWRPVKLVPIGGRWMAILAHPGGAKFVSLKASVSDPDGNAVDQTIIRAYGLR